MPEERTERTAYQGLLALMAVPADSESWGFPYWNSVLLDAALQGLAQAPRDGTAHLTAPALAPTTALVAAGGTLYAGQSLEVVQTFVDGFGRETLAGPAATQSTGAAIADPAAAATFGAITDSGTGFEGGLLEIWYSWTDGSGGETLPSPVATTDLPYLAGGLLSEVVVNLPSTPAMAGAAGANIYARHRSGNVVLAYQILVDSVSQATLTGVAADCYRLLPLVNSTFASNAVDVAGRAANAGESPALTRFYIRPAGTTWAAGDRRLKLAGLDQWNPATVTYPLRYTGATGELAPGYPPSVSQVKAIRAVDLASEVTGLLPSASIDAGLARDAEVATLLGGPYVLTGLLVEAQASPDMTVKTSIGWAISDERIWNPAADTSIAIAAAHGTLARKDIVCVNASGAIVSSSEDAACKGTADAAPVAPTTPAHYVLLAQVSVPAADTTIETAQITDSRVLHASLAQLDIDTDAHAAAATYHFTGTEKANQLLSAADKTDLTDGGTTTLHTHVNTASITEMNTGTDAAKIATADGVAGSYAGTKSMVIIAVEQGTDVSAADGKISFPIPPALNGMNLVSANAIVNTAGTTNATTIDIFNVTDSFDLLSTAISIASGATIGTSGTVDAAHDDVVTNDVLRVDVTTASTTLAKGLMVMLEFRLP